MQYVPWHKQTLTTTFCVMHQPTCLTAPCSVCYAVGVWNIAVCGAYWYMSYLVCVCVCLRLHFRWCVGEGCRRVCYLSRGTAARGHHSQTAVPLHLPQKVTHDTHTLTDFNHCPLCNFALLIKSTYCTPIKAFFTDKANLLPWFRGYSYNIIVHKGAVCSISKHHWHINWLITWDNCHKQTRAGQSQPKAAGVLKSCYFILNS